LKLSHVLPKMYQSSENRVNYQTSYASFLGFATVRKHSVVEPQQEVTILANRI